MFFETNTIPNGSMPVCAEFIYTSREKNPYLLERRLNLTGELNDNGDGSCEVELRDDCYNLRVCDCGYKC